MRIFLRRENWFSIKIEKSITKMAIESTILGQKSFANFQSLTHQITLLAGLHNLATFFTTKPKKIIEYSTTLKTFSVYFKFHLILLELHFRSSKIFSRELKNI